MAGVFVSSGSSWVSSTTPPATRSTASHGTDHLLVAPLVVAPARPASGAWYSDAWLVRGRAGSGTPALLLCAGRPQAP